MNKTVLFSIPKPFTGHIATIQYNAFASWSLLPDTTVVIFGNELGIIEACQNFGFKNIPHLDCNQHGTPYLDTVFKEIASLSTLNAILIYANSDIILLPTITRAIENIPHRDFLVAARRYNLDVDCLVSPSLESFSVMELHARLRGDVVPGYSSDIFILPASSCLIPVMPRMLIGRKGWDNWMMWAARKLKLPLIDATGFIVTVHQNHHHNHIIRDSTLTYPDMPWSGPESQYQEKLIGTRALSLDYATQKFYPNGDLGQNYYGLQKLYWHLSYLCKASNCTLTRFLFRLILKPLKFINDRF